MTVYKIGSTDKVMVQRIQRFLGITVDGIYGSNTQAAVAKYQRDNYLIADGIVGPKTLSHMGLLSTDFTNEIAFKPVKDLVIHKHYMPANEYKTDDVPMNYEYAFLHHTAGWDNPFNTIDQWARDSRGPVATEFVIGGINILTGDKSNDGIIVQSFPEGSYAWHLGLGNTYMHRHSVGIELCNFGPLTDTLKTWTGLSVPKEYVNPQLFRGKQYWHKYTDEQILKLKDLLLYIAARDNIDLKDGLVKRILDKGPDTAFSYWPEAVDGSVKGLLTHLNVSKYNYDIVPQPELVEMLLDI